MKIVISYPPLQGPGSPMLTQNRQFQWYHVPSYIYPLVPTSAATLLDSRSGIWPPAWQAFLRSPWVATGPFTYASTYLRANSVPPLMLLAHAHNYALNIATETGLVGVAALVWLASTLVVSVRRRWHTSTPSEKTLLAGTTASLIGIAVHSSFDTPQTMPTINLVIAIVIGIALVRPASVAQPAARPKTDYRLQIAAILFAGVMAGWAWSLWSYAPFERGVTAATLGQWSDATRWLDQAARRNPRLAFYQFQAGYAHGVRASAPALAESDIALAYYQAGTAIEPDWALNLANLAALDAQAGQRSEAIGWMGQATRLAPKEAAFWLNLGRYHEAAGDPTAATEAYREALELRPVWAGLPFWRQNALRQRTLDSWCAAHLEGTSPVAWDAESNRLLTGWNALAAGRAQEARTLFLHSTATNDAQAYLGLGMASLEMGQLDQADVALRTVLFMYPPALVRVEALFAQGELAHLRGDTLSAIARYENALDLLRHATVFGPGTQDTSDYGWYVYNRASIAPDLLPQLLYPTLTDGTLERTMELATWYEQGNDRDAAIRILREILAADPNMTAAQERLEAMAP